LRCAWERLLKAVAFLRTAGWGLDLIGCHPAHRPCFIGQPRRACFWRAPVTKASKSSYRGHQRSRNGSLALRGFRKLSLNMPRQPLRSVVWDTGFVTAPRRGWLPNPAVTYPDVCRTSSAYKAFRHPWKPAPRLPMVGKGRGMSFWQFWLPSPVLIVTSAVSS